MWQAAENAKFFVGKSLKMSQKLHGGDRRDIKVRKKTKKLKMDR